MDLKLFPQCLKSLQPGCKSFLVFIYLLGLILNHETRLHSLILGTDGGHLWGVFQSCRCEALTDWLSSVWGRITDSLGLQVLSWAKRLWNAEGRELTYNHSRAGLDDSSSYQPIAYITLMYVCMDTESRMFKSEGKECL